MDQEELLNQMHAAALAGEPAVVLELTSAGLEMGIKPETMLFGALIPALEEAGGALNAVTSMCPRCSSRAGRWPARSKC